MSFSSVIQFLCTLAVGGLLLSSAGPASAAVATNTVTTADLHASPDAAMQSSASDTGQQSMLPALIVAFLAISLTISRFFYQRRAKDRGT